MASSSGSISTSGSARVRSSEARSSSQRLEPGGQVAPVAADDATTAVQVGEVGRGAAPGARRRGAAALAPESAERVLQLGPRPPRVQRHGDRRRARWSPRTRSSTPGSSAHADGDAVALGRRRAVARGGRPARRRAARCSANVSALVRRRRGTPCRRRPRSSTSTSRNDGGACRNTRQGTPSTIEVGSARTGLPVRSAPPPRPRATWSPPCPSSVATPGPVPTRRSAPTDAATDPT